MAKHKKVVSDGEYASICVIFSPHLKVEDEVRRSKRENCGQGGYLGQLKKLERVQTKVRRPMKMNPAQNALDSQSVNIMAPEATKPKPRPRPVPKKSRTPMRLKLQGSKNQASMSEHLQESLSSPEEDIFRSQLCGPDSQFGFIPPDVFAEAGTLHLQMPWITAKFDDDIPSHPQSTNNSHMKTKKHAGPISVSQSTGDDATLPPPHMKKQDRAIVPPPRMKKNMPQSRPCPVSPTDSDVPSPPKRRQATHNPGRGNHHTGSPDNAGSIHNVLEDHHRKNHCPHTPDSDRLKNLCRQAAGESSTDKEDKVLDPPKRCPGGFEEEVMTRIGIEYLTETLNDFAADDIGVDDGYWDIYKRDMAIILWDDRATMRSEMKNAARPIAASKFGILPSDIDDDDEFEDYVSQRVTELLTGGYFLQNGVDEQGRTNNLAHDALGKLCSTIFYKGDNALAKAFPNVFAEAVPEGAVALAATALAAAINEYKTGVYQPTKFAADLYQPIYENVIELYTSVHHDRYHSNKCQAVRKKWARAAGVLTRNHTGWRHDWGLKLNLN
ncbi:hypothetical protein C8R48DRAFT_778874 [Suillus tomentosus]|nr:hypothetical protein C8R48DRAFT_778874 [Suillus tomentosus]